MNKFFLFLLSLILIFAPVGCSGTKEPTITSGTADSAGSSSLDSFGDGDSTTAAETIPETLPLDCASFPTELKLSDLPGLYAKLEHPATITKVDEYEGYWFVFFRLNEWDGVLSEYTQSIDRINPETGDRITDINAYGLPENYLIEKN
jgi:hypothetical protein